MSKARRVSLRLHSRNKRPPLLLGIRSQAAPTPLRKQLKSLRVAKRRTVAETDHFGFQLGQTHHRLAILHRVRTKPRRREPKAGLVREEMNVGQHVACNKESIAAAKQRKVARGMPGRFHHPKAAYLIAIAQRTLDVAVGARPDLVAETDDADVGLHRRAAIHRGNFAGMTGKRNAEMVAKFRRRSLMIGMAMRQDEQFDAAMAHLPEDPSSSPARAGIHQHIFEKVGIE